MKNLLLKTIAAAALTAAIVLPLGAEAQTVFPPIETWDCYIHNQANNPVAYHSNLGSGNIAAEGQAHLSGATISGVHGVPIQLNWSTGSCTVKYDENGNYPSTDKNVNCSVNGDNVTLSPTS